MKDVRWVFSVKIWSVIWWMSVEGHSEFDVRHKASYLRYTICVPWVIERETGNDENDKNPEIMKLQKTLRTWVVWMEKLQLHTLRSSWIRGVKRVKKTTPGSWSRTLMGIYQGHRLHIRKQVREVELCSIKKSILRHCVAESEFLIKDIEMMKKHL